MTQVMMLKSKYLVMWVNYCGSFSWKSSCLFSLHSLWFFLRVSLFLFLFFFWGIIYRTFLKKSLLDSPLGCKTYGQMTPPTRTNIQWQLVPQSTNCMHMFAEGLCVEFLIESLGVSFSCSYTHGNEIKNLEYSPLYHIWRFIN